MQYNYTQLINNSNLKNILNWGKTLGPIVYSIFKKTMPPDPEWWIGSIKLGKHPIGYFHTSRLTSAAGTSIFPEEALIRTIGEGIERYCSVNSHLTEIFHNKKVDETVGFSRCADFEVCSNSFKTNGLTEQIEHVKVKNLSDDSETLIPAEYVHLGYMRRNMSNMHTAPISTGNAFYTDVNTAIWKGLCEVVERDAMMLFWYTKKKPLEIDINSINDYGLKIRYNRIREADLQISLFEISDRINIPTIYALLQSDKFPYYCVGAATNRNIIKACNKAIDEAMSIRIMAKWNGYKKNSSFNLENFLWVNSLEKHMELYANWKNSPAFDFFVEKSQKITLKELEDHKSWIKPPENYEDLQKIAFHFKNEGLDIFWKDITTKDVKDFGHVVRVIVPQMIPLSQSYSTRWLAQLMDNYQLNDLNNFPHPFA